MSDQPATPFDLDGDGQVPNKVGVVGSPSSTFEATVDVTHDAEEKGLVGSVAVVAKHFPTGESEHALGLCSEVETRNQWHEDVGVRGLIANRGRLAQLSGDADVRAAQIKVQAVYERGTDGTYRPSGSALSMSPETGTEVNRVTNELIDEMVRRDDESLFYLGDIYRMPEVWLPFNTDHFDTPTGGRHAGVFGASGSGKTVFSTYYLAGQMRHDDLAVLVVDPQGQFASEHELPVSLQQFAYHLGRDVRTLDVATEVQLDKNRMLLVELLDKAGLFDTHITVGSGNVERARQVTAEFLEDYDREHGDGDEGGDWTRADPQVFTERLLDYLELNAQAVYSSEKPRDEFIQRLHRLRQRIDKPTAVIAPVLSLFAPTNLAGTPRTPIGSILELLFARTAGKPRAYVVLDMSARSLTGGDDEDDALAGIAADDAKALILRRVFDRLERQAERAFRQSGADRRLLNVQVAFDEARRYAPNPRQRGVEPEIAELSDNLARYFRETRKTGIGWLAIAQEPKDLNPALWEQMASGFRAIGFGLGGASLDMVAEHLDGPQSERIYRSFPQPAGSGKYPFMVMGAVSPLSFTRAPVFLNVVDSWGWFVEVNDDWVPTGAEACGQTLAGRPASLAQPATPAASRNADDIDVFADHHDDPF